MVDSTLQEFKVYKGEVWTKDRKHILGEMSYHLEIDVNSNVKVVPVPGVPMMDTNGIDAINYITKIVSQLRRKDEAWVPYGDTMVRFCEEI